MEDFRILENETKRCNSIEELFDIWQKAHMVDDDFADNCVFSDEEAKSNFCEDGKLGEKQPSLLFRCKESNLENDKLYGKKDVWLKRVVEAKRSGQYYNPYEGSDERDKKDITRDRKAQTTYYNCLCLICKNLGVDITDSAFMNINKRGGLNRTNTRVLSNYAEKYKEFIRAEIRLLNCNRVVVFSSNQMPSTVNEILKDFENEIIYLPFHPSRYSKKAVEQYFK